MGKLIGHLRRHQRPYLLTVWAAAGLLWLVGAIPLAVAAAIGGLLVPLVVVLLAEGKRHAPR